MSKPLELNVYPTWDNGFGDIYADKHDPMHPVRVDFEVYRKRLTDTELAAEFHSAYADSLNYAMSQCVNLADSYRSPEYVAYCRLDDIANTALRFATTPHAADS